MLWKQGYETTNHLVSELSKLSHKDYRTMNDMVDEGNPQGIVQQTGFGTYYQIVHIQNNTRLRK